MSWVTSSHHVLCIKHLLGELRNSEGSVLLAATRRQWGEPWHEEVEAGEGDHVDSQFSEIGIQLAREAEAGSDTRHGEGDEMVQVTICRRSQFECAEADVVEGLIVNAESLVCVLD